MNNGEGASQYQALYTSNGSASVFKNGGIVAATRTVAPTFLDYRNAAIGAPQPKYMLVKDLEQAGDKITFDVDSERDNSEQRSERLVAADAPLWPTIRPVTPEGYTAVDRRLVVSYSPSGSPIDMSRTEFISHGRASRTNTVGEKDEASPTKAHDGGVAGVLLGTTIGNGNIEASSKPKEMQITNDRTTYTSREPSELLTTPEVERLARTSNITSGITDLSPHNRPAQSHDRTDGSVFSTDERSLSQRVRSMYELGTEYHRQAERPGSSLSRSSHTSELEEPSVTLSATRLSPSSARLAGGVHASPRSTSELSTRSGTVREPGEAAGGAEDWTDVASTDVDRYGFIRSRSMRSKYSSMASAPSSGSPDLSGRQRPYTPLPAIEETAAQQSVPSNRMERRSSRRLSSAWPPTKSQNAPSVYSVRSQRSKISTFDFLRSPRTRQRHLMVEASRMLDFSYDPGSESALDSFNRTSPARNKLEIQRASKWEKMARPIRSSQSSTIGAGAKFGFDRNDPKVISRAWKGIPDRWRATAWYSFLETSASKHSRTGRPPPTEEELISRFHALQEIDCPDDVQIDTDVPRTIGQHIMFRKRYRGGQRLLFRVLRALALYFPLLGYVQGMAALVATLLCYFDEERAFVVAVRLWQYRGVGWLYKEGFGGLMEALTDFETGWMSIGDGGELKKKLVDELGVGPSVWGAKWYLTLFNYSLPFQAQLRVWDVFILLGDDPPISIPSSTSTSSRSRQMEQIKPQHPHPPSNPTSTSQSNEPSPPSAATPPPTDFQKPNLDILHSIAAALLLGLREKLLKADFETAMECLTKAVPVCGEVGEDRMCRVAEGIFGEARRRARG